MHSNHLRHALVAAVLVLLAAPSAPALQSSVRDVTRIRVEFERARDRIARIERDLQRPGREPRQREESLDDWQRILDGLRPLLPQLSADVPEQQRLLEQFVAWTNAYHDAAGRAEGTQFFMDITAAWDAVAAGTEGWEEEQARATWPDVLAAKDPAAERLGMPRTVAFVDAVTRYLKDVTGRDRYFRFKNFENVRNDLVRAEAARQRAYEKLALAGNAILNEAGASNLDAAGRDRLERFVERDLRDALAGSPDQDVLQSRGRNIISAFDRNARGEGAAADAANERLTRLAGENWPLIVARYNVTPFDPAAPREGQVVLLEGVRNQRGIVIVTPDYDFATFIGGTAVAGRLHPVVRDHLRNVLLLTGGETIAPEVDLNLIAVVRGTGTVRAIRTTAGPATTRAADGNTNIPITEPTPTDCVVLEIIAIRGGPACIGVNLPVAP